MSLHPARAVVALGLALAVLPACTGASRGSDRADEDVAVPVTQGTPADLRAEPVTQTVVTLDGDEEEVQVRPADLLEAVAAGVDAGRWSEPEGIVRALEGAVGAAETVPGLAAEDVEEAGLTGLARRAADLAADPATPEPDRAALIAALRFVTPTQDALDAISAPGPSASPSLAPAGAGAAVVRVAAVDLDAPSEGGCGEVATRGFSPKLDTNDTCYTHVQDVILGHRLRVYHPVGWRDDPARMALVGTTLDGLATSTVVYDELATVGDVNAVFSLTDGGAALASQAYFDLAEACPITIFPAASTDGDAVYLQTLAHEVFHCVQDRTFKKTSPYVSHKWWLEGSAEYFSNVVYPTTNDEHSRTGGFDRRSTHEPLSAMAYENTVFFQYLANRWGDQRVVDALGHVADGGGDMSALASLDGMEDLWQDFVVAFAADGVLDTGGGTVGGATMVSSVDEVTGEQQVTGDTAPFVATRFAFRYRDQMRFVQQHVPEPVHAAVPRARVRDQTAWTALPDEIRSGCDRPVTYIVVSTTVDRDLTFLADVTEAEKAQCDPCLLGPWEMQLATFESYMGNVFASLGDVPQGMAMDISGHYYVEFDAEGNLRSVRQPLTIGVVASGVSLPPTVVTGEDTGQYTTDGRSLVVSGLQGSAEASMGNVSVGPFASTGPDGARATYTCDRDLLTITDPAYGPITFDRIEQIPQPEAVEVETGSLPGSDG